MLFYAFQAFMVGLKSATVVFAPISYVSAQKSSNIHAIYQWGGTGWLKKLLLL
jgi:hypothetical protein